MAAASEPVAGTEELAKIAPVLSELPVKAPGPVAVDDVAFYGPRVMEFYTYFLNLEPTHVAATLALAAATLKAGVVIGQAVTETCSVMSPAGPIIPVKATAPAIPGRKRGRPIGSGKKHAG